MSSILRTLARANGTWRRRKPGAKPKIVKPAAAKRRPRPTKLPVYREPAFVAKARLLVRRILGR